jgi:hypothetical protein
MEEFMTTGVGSKSKIDTSGLIDSLDKMQDNFKKTMDLLTGKTSETGQTKEFDTIHGNVETAFGETPQGEDSLDDDNFNTIVKSLVDGDDSLTLDATNHLRDSILLAMGYKKGDKFSDLPEEQQKLFLDVLAKTIEDSNGSNVDDDKFDLKEFETMLQSNDFSGKTT